MAPRWLSGGQSKWSTPSGESPTLTAVQAVTLGLIVLVVGATLGWLVRGVAHASPVATVAAQSVRAAVVIDPTVAGLSAADKTADGAAKAATSFTSGFANVSIMSPDGQSNVLTEILAPTATATFRSSLQGILATDRAQVMGQPGAEHAVTAKLIYTPAVYKVHVQAPDRAQVEIWAMGVFVDPSQNILNSSWTTDDVELVWTNHWRVENYSSNPGPTPPVYATNGNYSNVNDVIQMLNGAKAFRNALG